MQHTETHRRAIVCVLQWTNQATHSKHIHALQCAYYSLCYSDLIILLQWLDHFFSFCQLFFRLHLCAILTRPFFYSDSDILRFCQTVFVISLDILKFSLAIFVILSCVLQRLSHFCDFVTHSWYFVSHFFDFIRYSQDFAQSFLGFAQQFLPSSTFTKSLMLICGVCVRREEKGRCEQTWGWSGGVGGHTGSNRSRVGSIATQYPHDTLCTRALQQCMWYSASWVCWLVQMMYR
jgi:hypothetical protein